MDCDRRSGHRGRSVAGMIRRFFKNSAGFTLVETLTAMMILAISLTAILQIFSGGLRASRVSDEYTRAIFHAREKMDEFLLLDRMRDEELQGTFPDGYEWTARIVRMETENNTDEAADLPVDLFGIVVTVFWNVGDQEKQFEISTLHLADGIGAEDAE